MKKFKLGILIFIITLYSLLLCGCWNYREIDSMAIVAGMAIDKNTHNNSYIVSVEIITIEPQGLKSIIRSELYSSEGVTIFDAVRNMIEKIGMRPYWSHAKTVIISKAIAKEGIIPVIDWINRDSETRSDMWVIISKGDSALEILKSKVKINEVVSFHLDDILKSQSVISKYVDSKLLRIIDDIGSENESAAVATVQNELLNNELIPNINGCAIFKTDKLVGFLSGEETFYMLMIKNKIKKGVITLKKVSQTDTDITLEIFNNKTKLTPIYSKGNLTMVIDVHTVVAINEIGGTKGFMTGENLKELKGTAEKKLEIAMQNLINKLQMDYNSDVLDFQGTFKREKPEVFDAFRKKGEDIFPNIITKVASHIEIKGSGTTQKPITKGK